MQILMHWACAKITAAYNVPDEQLMAILEAKLKEHKLLQFTTIASHAQGQGRKVLAAQLLSYEKDPSKQASPARHDATLNKYHRRYIQHKPKNASLYKAS